MIIGEIMNSLPDIDPRSGEISLYNIILTHNERQGNISHKVAACDRDIDVRPRQDSTLSRSIQVYLER